MKIETLLEIISAMNFNICLGILKNFPSSLQNWINFKIENFSKFGMHISKLVPI